jgi:hypothetical protein
MSRPLFPASVSIASLSDMEHAMLPPIAAVSATLPVAQQREVVAVAEVLSGLVTEPDGAVALSLAASSGVEGRLNMLLIAARERMVDSLFAVIDAVSQSLALPQETGESNAVYALRLADAITDLAPKQMAALQQQLAAQGQTAPLSLVAAALHDPTSTQAAQLVAYLEVVRYKDKDLATKSVVASYGQNDGSTEADAGDALATLARNAQAQAATIANPAARPQAPLSATSAPVPPAAASAPTDLPDAVHDASTPSSAVSEEAANASPQAQTNQPSATAGNLPLATRLDTTVAQALQAMAPEIAAAELPAETPAPSSDEATPRVILQIRSDVQEGLKAVFDRLVQATGTELLQTMAEAEPLADKVIAQALIADMIDGTELNGLPVPDNSKVLERATPLTNALPVALPSGTIADEAAEMVAASQPLPDAPEPAATTLQQPLPVVTPTLVVGFATTPYAPAEDVVKNKDSMPIDRVDAVDDDEHEEPGNQQQRDGAAEDEPETAVEEVLDMLAAEPDSFLTPVEEPPASRAALIALPRPAAEPQPMPLNNLYERMGA